MTEQFYRNIAALKEAEVACLDYQVHDLDAWVFAQLAAHPGENVLNIGCDNNEQILSLSSMLGPDGYTLAIDRSYRALHTLSQRSQEVGLENNIRFLYLDLDDLAGHVHPENFERALGGRALSHVKQPQAVFQAVRQALKMGGVFFFYGPSRKDLMELRLFYGALRNEVRESRAMLFMEQIGIPCARNAFAQAELVQFECPLRFTSPDALYAYWRESELYEETLDKTFRQAAVQHFQSYAAFETAQRLLGIKAING
jgi:ubiquinone/menaquinone biosynthesis C-methylase UbiE